MTKLQELKKQLLELKQEQEKITTDISEVMSNQTIKCLCGKYHKIKDMDMIIPQGWVNSSGYEDGYNYDTSLHAVCKTDTSVSNRLWFETKYQVEYFKRDKDEFNAEKQFTTQYLHLFKTVQRIENSKVPYSKWGNNTYIDDNHSKFNIKAEV